MTITARVSERASHVEIDGKSYPVATVRAAPAATVASAAPSGELPPLPELDTHCFDEDEKRDVWSYSAELVQAYTKSAIASSSPKAALTDERIKAVATAAYKSGKLSWLGFEKDADDKYRIPVLSVSDYQFARAIEAASGPNVALVAALKKLQVAIDNVELPEGGLTGWRAVEIASASADAALATIPVLEE